jgi:hypothetical protein
MRRNDVINLLHYKVASICRHYCRQLPKSRNERSRHVTWQVNGGYISEISEEHDDSWGHPKEIVCANDSG